LPGPIRLLIADDHPIVRMGLRYLLQAHDGFTIVGESVDGDHTLDLVRQLKPDAVLLDVAMPGRSGLEVLRQLSCEPNPTRTILLTAGIEEQQLVEALQLGARGVVIKDSPQCDLIEAIHAVNSGRYWIDREMVASLVDMREKAAKAAYANLQRDPFGLRAHELQAIISAVEGCVNPDFAQARSTSENTSKRNGSAVRVLVADSMPMGGQLIVDALRQDKRFLPVGVLTAPDEITTLVSTLNPDVAIVAVGANGSDCGGFALLRHVLARYPKVKPVMLLESSTRDFVVEAFRAGARGVVCRNESLDVLRNSVYAVHLGLVWANNTQLRFALEYLPRRCLAAICLGQSGPRSPFRGRFGRSPLPNRRHEQQ
jgi:two-component system, NarL family, nitrate/nitrite response regulator NarL